MVWTTNADPRCSIRTCVGCRRRRSRTDLVRCVVGDDGRARIDAAAPGRGAWLCGPDCLDAALRRRGFDRAWRTPAPPTVREDLLRAFDALEHDDVMATAPGPTRHETLTTRVKG